MKAIGLVGASCRAMAASLCRIGISVEVADMFADIDTQRIAHALPLSNYPWSAYSWLMDSQAEAWCYTGGLENYPRLITRLSKLRPLLGNSAQVLQLVRDPIYLSRLAEKHGFQYPETTRSPRQPLGNGWLVKPKRSAGGLHIERYTDSHRSHQSRYFQREIPGTVMSLAVLSTSTDFKILGASRLRVGLEYGAPCEFVFAGATSVPIADLPGCDELQEMVEVIHTDTNLVGLWGMDFVLADRPVLLEINPRWTATMPLYERRMERSLMASHVDACRDQCLSGDLTEWSGTSGLRIVYASCTFEFSVEHLSYLSAKWNLSRDSILGKPTLADIPNVGTRIEKGHPICSIYADGANENEVEKLLEERVAHVRMFFNQSNTD